MWFNQQSTMSVGCLLLIHPELSVRISHLIIVIKERTVHNGENGAHTELWRNVHLFSPFRTHFTQRSNYRQLLIDLLCWVRRSFTKLPPTLVLLFGSRLFLNSTHINLSFESNDGTTKTSAIVFTSTMQSNPSFFPLSIVCFLLAFLFVFNLQPSSFRWMIWPPIETGLSVWWVSSRFNFISSLTGKRHHKTVHKHISGLWLSLTRAHALLLHFCLWGRKFP